MTLKAVLLAYIVSVALAAPQREARTNLFEEFSLDYPLDQFGFDDNEITTPVPILRHVNTVNPDGSYSYGYESGDGSYKIETKYATGEVKGKYGYYDPTGMLREVEYGHTPTAPDPDYPDYPDEEPLASQSQRPPLPVSQVTQPSPAAVIRRPRPQPSGLSLKASGLQPLVQPQFSNFEQPRSQQQPRFAPRPPPKRPTIQPQFAAPPQQPTFRVPQLQSHPFLTNTIDWAKGVYSYQY